MGKRVCPWWLGYLLANPLRRLYQNPAELLTPYVKEGMRVLEPGPGMGFFTLELARLVGLGGQVVAVDIQPKMIAGLKRRVARAGFAARVQARLASPLSLHIDDLAGAVDFALVFALVHELPEMDAFFGEMAGALKPGALLLLAEPTGHVSSLDFDKELQVAANTGLAVADRPRIAHSRAVLLTKRPEPSLSQDVT